MQSNDKYRVYLGLCIVAMETRYLLGVSRNEKLEAVVTQLSKDWRLSVMLYKKAFCKVQWLRKMQYRWEPP